MLRGEFDAADAADADALLAEYGARLAAVVDREGVETVRDQAGLSTATVEAIRDGDSETVGALELTEAAEIVALEDDRPDADVIAAEARDVLLLGMTTAVVDVETLASALDGAIEPKELQQKVEGRYPMTLAEYARVHYELGAHAE
jgi:hypothetical protein